MKRALLLLLCVTAWPAGAAEKWLEAYNRGVNAVRANNFQAGAQALQRAIEEMPQENAAQRVRDQIFTYVPHFWLGIAKLNLADPDGALQEWRVSEDQAAIRNTPYYAQLQDLIARANSEKRRQAESAATPAKQEANGAISRALSAQMDAVTAGGDRSETYRSAQRKLGDAKGLNAKGGLDVRAYKHAAEIADEARALFASAADDAKKQRAARPVKPAVPSRKPASGEIVIPFDDPSAPKEAIQPAPQTQTQPAPQPPPQPVVPLKQPPVPPVSKAEAKPKAAEPPPEPESEALVAARIAVQQYRRRLVALNLAANDAQRLERQLARQSDPGTIRAVVDEIAAKEKDLDRRTAEISSKAEKAVAAPDVAAQRQLESAYRAYATGDLTSSDRILTDLLSAKQSAEAYLLRGCSRFTQAMLSRRRDVLLASAAADMQTALRLNHSLRLDPVAWSPKLVAFFEKVKGR